MPLSAVDWIIIIVLAIAAINGLVRGFFISAFGLLGLIASLLVASRYYESVARVLHPVLRNQKVSEVVAFLLLLILVSLLAALVGKLLRNLFAMVGLGWLDQLAGLLFGLLEGAFLVIIFVVFLAAFWPNSSLLKDSQLGPVFLASARTADILTPESMARRVHEGIHELEKTRDEFLHPQTKLHKNG